MFIKVSMVRRSPLGIFYFNEKFCVSHASGSHLRDVLLLNQRSCRENYITLRFTYAYPILFLSNYNRKEPQRSSCGSNILPQRSSCAFIMQPQRSSCGFQDSSSSDPQSAAKRTSSCGRKKKFLRVHYFWAVL